MIFIALYIFSFISIVVYLLYTKNNEIVHEKEYWDKLLDEYIKFAYENVYSTHILPYIASGTSINMDPNDKTFISISNMFLDTLHLRAGNTINKIYYKLYKNKEEFEDVVMSIFILKLKEDLMDSVIKPNISSTFSNTNDFYNSIDEMNKSIKSNINK